MSLVWHIARKDIRRLALPVVAWLALIIAPAVAFRLVSLTVEGHVASSIGTSVSVISIWVRLLLSIQALIGFVLTAALVMEDALVGSNGFWMTRPIANARLLAAKLVGAALLFVALPVVGLALVWLASGFSAEEMWRAGWEIAGRQGIVTLLALAVASLSRNLAQAIFFTIAIGGAYFASLWLVIPAFQGVPLPVRLSRYSVTTGAQIVAALLVLLHQFLTRRSARTWATLGVAFVGCLAVNAAWPWDVRSDARAGRRAAEFEERPQDSAAEIVIGPTLTKFNRAGNELPSLFVTAPWRRDAFYVPVYARFADGSIARGASGVGAVESGLRALGLKNEEESLRWQVMVSPGRGLQDNALSLRGTLEVWAVAPRIMAEIPLQAGASGANGASRIRIVELGRKEDRLDEIFIEERDAASTAHGGWSNNWSPHDVERIRYIDRFFLVNRGKQKAQHASATELSAIEMHSLMVQFRRLHVSGTDDWRDGVLIKLRFECERRFERPFEVQGITTLRP